jgi:protein required for attachment to host cells
MARWSGKASSISPPTHRRNNSCDERLKPSGLRSRSPPAGLDLKESLMRLPNNALVLVADGRKMLLFRNHGDENQIDLRTETHDARKDRKDRDIKTDAPGTNQQSFGYGHSTYEETDFHQLEEDRWIKDAADELKKRALRNDFDALAIVAPPKALGVIKRYLHKEVTKRTVSTINKEMSGRTISDIEALLGTETRAPLPTV